MSSLLEKILEEAKALTPEERQRLRDALDHQASSAEQAERNRLASSIRGKYADVLTGSDEFAVRKGEDLALEERS